MDRGKIVSLLMIAFSITLAVGGQFLLKAGMNNIVKVLGGSLRLGGFDQMKTTFVQVFTQPLVLVGLALYVFSSVSWLIVLSRVELSFAYPLAALGYVVAIAVSAIVLKENVTAVRWIGALLICAGVIFISMSGEPKKAAAPTNDGIQRSQDEGIRAEGPRA
ncbi:MAG: hypothetical protein M1335_04155 [Chloroflexi bacterium]|nr:hypothetical protein [Chloroflexota bacterium]